MRKRTVAILFSMVLLAADTSWVLAEDIPDTQSDESDSDVNVRGIYR